MSAVLDLQDVTVRRGTTTILDHVTWQVEDGQRWVVLGPNGAGKTTMLQIASGRMHPTSGTATILGERLGAVDVFELRPRIGVASAALADRISPAETVLDVVLTAAYGMTGRWREQCWTCSASGGSRSAGSAPSARASASASRSPVPS
jgi:iron complex transport system ATP-binding protein